MRSSHGVACRILCIRRNAGWRGCAAFGQVSKLHDVQVTGDRVRESKARASSACPPEALVPSAVVGALVEPNRPRARPELRPLAFRAVRDGVRKGSLQCSVYRVCLLSGHVASKSTSSKAARAYEVSRLRDDRQLQEATLGLQTTEVSLAAHYR